MVEESKNIYVMMEISYIKAHNRDVKNDNNDLFPLGWYQSTNYVLKSQILLEAINNKIDIIDTQKYQELLEGVKEK